MKDKAEELARQLLETTERGNLVWRFVPETSAGDKAEPNRESYRTEIGSGFSLSISRWSAGDNKFLDFELTEQGRTVLSAAAANFPIGPKTRELLKIRNLMQNGSPMAVPPIDADFVARFRLFSDLFYAARQSASDGDSTIERVQEILSNLASSGSRGPENAERHV
jgi:hypothetical protein